MLGLFLLSFLLVSSTIAPAPRVAEDYDYYSTYDDSPAQTEGGSNPADSTTDSTEQVGAGDYSNNEDYANDDYSYYEPEPPAQKEGGSNPTGVSEEEAMSKEEDSKKNNYENEYWNDGDSARVGDLPDSGDEKEAEAETQSSKEEESNDYYDYNQPEPKEEESEATSPAAAAVDPSQLEKYSNGDEEDYNDDYDYSNGEEEESAAPSKEESSPNYDNYDEDYDAMKEKERPTQKEKDENEMTEQESDYDHKDYEWHDSQNSKDYYEGEDYMQKRDTRGIKRVPRRRRPHRRPHQRRPHEQSKQLSPEDISPTPTTDSPRPDNPASSHSQATSSSPPTVPTPSPDESKYVEPSSREVLLQHAINSYTVTTMHQLDTSKILELYKQHDPSTMKFAKTLFKTLVAMRLARITNYKGFDKPNEVVRLLKKDGYTKHTDFFIVRFLCKYYKGLSGAIKYYLRIKARSSTLELPRHGETEIAHQNQDNVRHHYHHHFHHDGSSKHEVNKRDKTAKGGHRPKNYFKRKLEEFRKKRAIVAAAAKHDTDSIANQHRVKLDLDVKRISPQKIFRSKRSQRQRPHRPLEPILPAVYEAAQRQKAKEAGSTCRTNRGRILSNGEIHKDDCNVCKCRNGELHCTQLKCREEPIIQISGDMTSTSAARKNKCQKCNVMPKEEVCGANGKTYNSLCHAINCGGLNIMDIRPGGCETDEDPCTHSQCEENEICVPRFRGPCIGLYGYGKIKGSCSLYRCVPRHQCQRARRRKVCGSNGKTYHSLCSLYHSQATLAYHGPCQPEKCSSPVCGSNGVTYKSSCHAHARSVRIDYAGECLAVKLSKENTCEVVRNEKMRCGKMNSKCRNWIIPHGSCCPICGSSFTLEPDTKEFSKLQESKNHLLTVKRKVSKLIPEIKGKCDLSASLGDKDDITFVLHALSGKDEGECVAAGKHAVDIINNNEFQQDGDAVMELLAPAALKQDIIQ